MAQFDKPLYTYDLETYFDTFLFAGKFVDQAPQVFEISWRKNQRQELLNFLKYLKNIDAHMVGYNSLGFDYPIIHDLMLNPLVFDAKRAFDLAQKIIGAQTYGMSPYNVSLHKRLIHQIDLVKIHHFDNKNKRTRLKDLQFTMRSLTVEDLPYDFRKPLSFEEIDNLISYNIHDVTETEKFLMFSMERLQLRRDLIKTGVLKGDVLNFNDTKLGEQFLVSKIGRDVCYSGSKAKGTDRLRVDLKDVILPKVKFALPEFNEVLENYKGKFWLKGDKDHNEQISFSKTINGITFGFGIGGIHGSVKNKIYRSTDTHKIIDIDVSSYYPSIGIVNGFYPEHLGEMFLHGYGQLKIDRKQYAKGTALNGTYKLGLNGAYGKSNSEYSPMFDIKYMFSITINGQLQLLQLIESLTHVPGLSIIQANTDGITAYVPTEYVWLFEALKASWERDTGYDLEEVEYDKMFIADVNSYLAVKKDGSVKRKGRYWYAEKWSDYDSGNGHWHTDNSQHVVAKVAEQVMLHGYDPRFVLHTMKDPFDFMIREKIIGAQKGFIGGKETQRTVRYYVSTKGEEFKVIKPAPGPVGQYKRKSKLTDKFFSEVMAEIGPNVWDPRVHTGKAGKPETQKKYEDVKSSVKAGFLVKDCCDARAFDWSDVDYNYYLEEVNKIIIKE